MDTADHMTWRIVLRAHTADEGIGLPASVVTVEPGFHHDDMPPEVAMLLPTNLGPAQLIDRVIADPARYANTILGLFLASPFLNVGLESARLQRAGIYWVANLPSVSQQDDEFAEQLPDVGLSPERELERMSQFRALGFRTAVVVADAPGAEAAVAIEPEVIIVMPRVAGFAAGFPSLRQRGTAAQSVAETAEAAGWSGVLLGLGEDREAESEELWPGRLDGLICRPEVAGAVESGS